MIIKYTVWWYEKVKGRKKQKFHSDEIEYDIDFDDDAKHGELRQAIRAKHPGSVVAVYAPKEVWDDPTAWEKSSINESLNPHI
jgi:hypothetical protein